MSRGHRSRGGTNRHFIRVGPLPGIAISSSSIGQSNKTCTKAYQKWNLWSMKHIKNAICLHAFQDDRLHILLRATSHTRLRARDHYTLSILIGGKGGASPSSLHIRPWLFKNLDFSLLWSVTCPCFRYTLGQYGLPTITFSMDEKSTWNPTWQVWTNVNCHYGDFKIPLEGRHGGMFGMNLGS